MEIDKDADSAKIEENIINAFGNGDIVKKLSPRSAIEIGNIDPTVDKQEILAKIADKAGIGVGELRIKSFKSTFSGNSRAIIDTPASAGTKLEGKIVLGFTSCLIKIANNIIRCYRCHGFGHISYNCEEARVGSNICRRCGKDGHSIKECSAESKCRLCAKQGLAESMINHVAGALSCPQFKAYLGKYNSVTAPHSQ